MKNRVLYILLLILLSGCVRPWGVLSQDEMVAVLLDVHIAEAAMKVVDGSAKRVEKQEYYNVVFEKHHTTKEQFEKIKQLGIEYTQGFYFSKPIPENEFLELVK